MPENSKDAKFWKLPDNEKGEISLESVKQEIEPKIGLWKLKRQCVGGAWVHTIIIIAKILYLLLFFTYILSFYKIYMGEKILSTHTYIHIWMQETIIMSNKKQCSWVTSGSQDFFVKNKITAFKVGSNDGSSDVFPLSETSHLNFFSYCLLWGLRWYFLS